VRSLALVIGAALIAVAFVAAGRVADTREGLIAEVITLLAGLMGVSLVLYAWVSRARPRPDGAPMPEATPAVQIRSATELVAGAAGLVIAAGLIAGVGLSAGGLWVLMAAVLLLPMILGSGYLCLRFLRAPKREWKIDLRQLARLRW
jgi:peptidoglycan/LPS O-acetylase OafA/YrhL